jgi:monofunctional biosynthetic peptidoglycan transglycosylase
MVKMGTGTFSEWLSAALILVCACYSATIVAGEEKHPVLEKVPVPIFDFAGEGAIESWYPVHDVVMGGVSEGGIRGGEGTAVFAGTVSLDRGGGFASIRSRPEHTDLSARTGLELHVKGDGKRYDLNLRNDAAFDGIYYKARFEASATGWTAVRIPFESFVPTYRGRVIRDAPPLDPAKIMSFGLMISDKQEGPFRLEIRRIAAY